MSGVTTGSPGWLEGSTEITEHVTVARERPRLRTYRHSRLHSDGRCERRAVAALTAQVTEQKWSCAQR